MTRHVVEAINGMLTEIAGFDEQFQSIVEATAEVPDANLNLQRESLIRDENQFAKESKNYAGLATFFSHQASFQNHQSEIRRRAEKSLRS